MKAYKASFDGEEWMTLIHGESTAKAKYRFMRCEPTGFADKSMWVDARLVRLPEWDNRPFVDGEEIRLLFLPSDYTEDGEGLFDPFVNDCDCELCKARGK
jgi:hypothetical protein